MDHLSADRVNRLAESETIAMSRRSRELQEQGIRIINLSLGEPDFNTPDFIREAAKQAIDEGYSHYPPVPGYPELRQAIAHKFQRDNGLNYAPSQIVVSTGAKQTLINLMLSLVNPGEEVILPAPYWVSYRAMVQLAEGKVVTIPTTVESEFKFTAEQLEAHITPKTKLLLFSAPCNPTGTVYSRSELEAIARVLEKHPHVLAISDEIYEHIQFAGKHVSLAQFDFIHDRVITVNGVSKSFAMTGWRIGYMGGPQWVADAVTKMQGQFTSATNGIAQKAAQAALEADPASIGYMKEKFEQRRDLVMKRLREIPGLRPNDPEGAFYVFPNVASFFGSRDPEGNEIKDASDLCMYLLRDAHVALVPGSAFGNGNCVRVSYATSEEELTEALDRVASSLSKLNK